MERGYFGGFLFSSLAGIFGPRSMTWRVDREAAIFLGAGRALLLQLAHPWVAAAIEQHSDTFADPISRFHRTFSVVFTMVFGRLEQSLQAARRLHRRHAAISGTMQLAAGPFPAGSFYCANGVPALRWVARYPQGDGFYGVHDCAAGADAGRSRALLCREPAFRCAVRYSPSKSFQKGGRPSPRIPKQCCNPTH